MPQGIDHPYWLNWLRWTLVDSHRKTKVAQRRTAWEFINRVRRMPRGSLAIDGGANFGSVTAALVRRGVEVHAFEPDPHALAALKSRFGGNPLVMIHAAAVGAVDGTLQLYRTHLFNDRPDKATRSSSLFPRSIHDTDHGIEVAVVDLARFIRDLGRPVDMLKLDVEGAEIEIVERLIDDGTYRMIGAAYVETHERHSEKLAERTAALRRRVAEAGIDNINLDWQ